VTDCFAGAGLYQNAQLASLRLLREMVLRCIGVIFR
jgi:hypothetical protein